MAMTYDQLNTYLQTLLVDQAPSADYTAILPSAIQYAENRIYREMNFLATRVANTTGVTVSGTRSFTIPTSPSTIIIVEGVAIITPAGQTNPRLGKRVWLEPISRDALDMTWPTESQTGLPDSYAMKTDAVIDFKPTPDGAYTVELLGIFRPTPMSSGQQTSYIGQVYPDLLIAACMIYLSGYQRDFGAQTADPQMAVSWESQYGIEFKSAFDEEQRRKGAGVGWSPFQPTPEAQPART